ncbi:hypothetical protein [Xylanibacter ruminicola]|nr:hypothetical protein [Xylanibacter ruminicola]
MMRGNNQMIHPAIQARVDFYERLESDVKKASVGSEIRILYEKFAAFCINLGISQSLGNHPYEDETCNEDFRKELLSNIDMAKHVCMSKRDGLSSGTALTINNSNQQEQTQNLSINVRENLRKALTGEQYDELLALIDRRADKKTIVDKIKDFGIDVVSGVLAGIISSQMT